jgi:GNAT superfamily N-acetyltransferase
MQNITIEIVEGAAIEQCRELCDELMEWQKSKARLHPERFESMNFSTRMKKSYEHALRKQVIVAKDNGVPVGYVFAAIDAITEADRGAYPEWAPAGENYTGFYPSWVKLPQNIGCLNNLYLRDAYRHSGLGSRLFAMSMEWLESFPDVALHFVYISNGNDAALAFYLKHGFTFSHDVFGGFIQAAYMLTPRESAHPL